MNVYGNIKIRHGFKGQKAKGLKGEGALDVLYNLFISMVDVNRKSV